MSHCAIPINVVTFRMSDCPIPINVITFRMSGQPRRTLVYLRQYPREYDGSGTVLGGPVVKKWLIQMYDLNKIPNSPLATLFIGET